MKKLMSLGIPAMVLAAGLAFIGCELDIGGGSDGDTLVSVTPGQVSWNENSGEVKLVLKKAAIRFSTHRNSVPLPRLITKAA